MNVPNEASVLVIEEFNRYITEYLIDIPNDQAIQIMLEWADIKASHRFEMINDNGFLIIWNKIRNNEVYSNFIDHMKTRLWFSFGESGMSRIIKDLSVAISPPVHSNKFLDKEYKELMVSHEELNIALSSNPWLVVVILLKFIPSKTFRFVQSTQS